jgi:hypothetical protein
MSMSRRVRAMAGAALGAALLSAVVAVPHASAASGWAATATMASARGAHVATALADGRVLVAGGFAAGAEVAGSELYDPATRTWTPTGPLHTARHYAAMTRLADGRVLLAGGFGTTALASAELYDPATGAWTVTGSMGVARVGPGITTLPDGRVLVAGGETASHAGLASAELYDPASGTWTPTGSMATTRAGAAQALLADGRVLVAGGYDAGGGIVVRSTSELYTPATGTWAATGSLAAPRAQGAFAQLSDGRVVWAGGITTSAYLGSAEVYDRATGTWAATGGVLAGATDQQAATALPDGRALVAGGLGRPGGSEVFDPATGAFADGGALVARRIQATATTLPDGRVLLAGGQDSGTRLASAEVWTPPTTRAAEGGDLGATAVGAAVEGDVVVRDTGAARLFVDGVALTGADAGAFSIVADGCGGRAVLPGATCTVRVRFDAAGAGTRTAQLRLDDNAGGAAAPVLTATATVPPAPAAPAPAAPGAGAPAPARPAPPAACSSRRRFTVSKSLSRTIRSGVATLNGKRIARLSRGRRTITVDLRGRRAGTYTLRITIRTTKGKTIRITRRYRTCAAR